MKTKAQKQREAAERQAEYDSLSVAQKLERIAKRRGNSAKERAKLLAQQAE